MMLAHVMFNWRIVHYRLIVQGIFKVQINNFYRFYIFKKV